jgi:hypothetical protein
MVPVRRNVAWSASVPLLCLIAALVMPASAAAQQLPLSHCAPDQNTFTLTIDNAYFPLPVGAVWVYTGKEQGDNLGLQISVLPETEPFRFGRGRNVTTRVVTEVEWADTDADGEIDADEELIEVSRNYFAQTQTGPAPGTVCYFGEDVDIYEDGEIVSHEGAWRADGRRRLPGRAPGIFMPANAQAGMSFQQEDAPGVAEDQATILRTGTATLPDDRVVNTLVVRDFNPLDGSRGTKVYGQGVGLIEDGPLRLTRVEGV